ncbi:MAG: hypothetical protein MJE68_21730 [Proteobacteria bacterium]|nr:hypothetical protein [Pseudomonadota bacterium]
MATSKFPATEIQSYQEVDLKLIMCHYTVMFDNNSFSHSVPPLTQGSVLEAVKGVQDWDRLRYYFGVDPVSSLEDAVEEFLLGRGFYQPSWRAVIFILDLMDKVQIADRIRNHGEPVQGGCMYFPSAAPIIWCGPGWISRANNKPLIIL